MSVVANLRRALTPRRVAQVAIFVEMLVIARTLGEIYRLRAVSGAAFGLDAAMIWVTAATIALAFLALSTALYFLDRHRLSGGAAVAMVVVLVIYKGTWIGWSA